jgi:integrase
LTELVEHVRVFGLGPEGLLFTNAADGAVWSNTWSVAWRKAAAPLGIPTRKGFHQLRHYYASLLIQAGESVKVVQERLGHASAAMTLNVYSHLWPDSEDRTRKAVDDVFGSNLTPDTATISNS